MKVTFTQQQAPQRGVVSEAELILEGELRGLKLAGFTVRESFDGEKTER